MSHLQTGAAFEGLPVPADQRTVARWDNQRLRRRILESAWAQDLRERYLIALGPVKMQMHRAEFRGMIDQTSNLLRSYSAAQSTLYDRLTTWDHENEGAARVVSDALARAGHQPLMQRLQRNTVAIREGVLSIDIFGQEGKFPKIVLRPVPADYVEMWALDQAPDVPVRVREAMPRQNDKGRWEWVYQETSIDPNEPGTPYRRVVDSKGKDVSPEFLVDGEGNPAPAGGFVGDAYPDQDANGAWIPYVLYHFQRTGRLWDWTEGQELVEGTLNIGVLWTFWNHIARQASWPQRVLIDGEAAGSDEEDGQKVVVGDPSSVVIIQTAKRVLDEASGGTASIDQWEAGADLESVERAIALYERRVAGMAGISPTDVQRVAGDPRSGFAIALTNDAQRESQRRLRPSFERGDRVLASIVARSLSKLLRINLPSGGYAPVYAGIPLSADELEGTTDVVIKLRGENLMTERQALRLLYPDLTDSQLTRLQEELAGTAEDTDDE